MKRQRQSTLCPNCNLLISVSEAYCPYCGVRSPAAAWRRMAVFRLLSDAGLLVKAIIGANIALYAFALMLDPRGSGFGLNPLMLLSPSDQSLFLLGASGRIPIDTYHRWWSLVSAGYLHAGLLHIFFNMAALRQLAAVVAAEFGPRRMFVIYSCGSVGGFLVSYLAGVPLTVGASAGVCGLVGAVLYYGRSRGGVYGSALFRQVGMWVVAMFVFGFILPVINNWAHAGGIVVGAVAAALLGYNERRRESRLSKTLAAACLAVTALVLAWAAVTGVYYRLG
jgi:rhomboid protease GluP